MVEAARRAVRPKVLVSTRGMSREDWLEWRRKGIGGSDSAVVLGLSRWKSPTVLWFEKRGHSSNGEAGEAAHWGNLLEPVVANEFSLITGFRVHKAQFILQHPDFPWMLANVDRLVTTPDGIGVLEIKTAGEFRAIEWRSGAIPQEYMCQVQHYLAVTGYDFAYIAVLIGGQRFEYLRIDRDDELIDRLIEAEANFWETVELEDPPQIDGSDATAEWLQSRYPRAVQPEPFDLPRDAKPLVEAYLQASKDEREAARRKSEAQNQLEALLGDHEVGRIGRAHEAIIVKWANVVSRRLDTKRLKTEKPDLYEEYNTETQTRRFTVTPYKEKDQSGKSAAPAEE